MCLLRPLIAVQLREVEREAKDHDLAVCQSLRVACEKGAFTEGFNAAKEKAAEWLKGKTCGATFPNTDTCDCGNEFSEHIGEMKP